MKTRIIKWFIMLLLVSTVVSVEAQTTDELLQLGTQEVQGTARFTGLGGAFNALGGDFGSLSTNPAGIATYRSSEFVITPALTLNKATTDFRGESLSDNRTRFGFANLGYISTYLTQKSDGLVSVNFGIGYNRTANFYKRARLRGYDSPNSVLNMFTQYANNLHLIPNYLKGEFKDILSENWTTAMALYSEMIRYDDNGIYYSNGLNGDKIDIYSSTLQSGGTNEYTFSFGGNISNRFQFGLTIGLQDLEYINTLNYREKYIGDLTGISDKYISSFKDEYTRTVGFGVNAKFGIIYRPIDAFRLGFAVHTPTFFNMERKYQVYMSSLYKTAGEDDSREESSPSDIYEYTLTTPYRLEFGLAYIFGKIGLISVDYELVGNNSMRIRDNIFDDTEYISVRNDAIKKNYRNTSNVRVGAEINLSRGLMLRAGFNYFQSPYNDSSLDFTRYAYSGGIGYRNKYFFLDLAYTLNTGKYYFAPYFVNDYRVRDTDENPDVAVENLKIGRIIATIGFKF
jgi:long-subunit fatty acid transport protein